MRSTTKDRIYLLLLCLALGAVWWILNRDPAPWLAAAAVISAMDE